MLKKKKRQDFIDLTREIDVDKFRASVRGAFLDFPDPRATTRCIYPAWLLFLVILSGYLAGCNTIGEISHFAELREAWLMDLAGLEMKVPSYSTLWWFLIRVHPTAFKGLIAQWFHQREQPMQDQLLAIDGKRLRGVSDREHISHIVELFSTERGLILAQEKVPDMDPSRGATEARRCATYEPNYLRGTAWEGICQIFFMKSPWGTFLFVANKKFYFIN